MSEQRLPDTTIAPWLGVIDGDEAVEFYKAAFGAVEVYRLEGDDGKVAVAQLKVGVAALWVQADADAGQASGGEGSVRMILTVDDPDTWFAVAIAAGATQITPVGEEHGWRTGRVLDPFGHDWEFSKPVSGLH